jgi:exodeoxyribonuclease VII large subunit
VTARPKPEREGPQQLTLEARLAPPPLPLATPTPAPVPAPAEAAVGVPPPVAVEPPPAPPVPAAPRIYVVSELIRAARLMLESRFADVRVEGEISGLKRSGSGHIYFCLKDEEAQVDCVMFSREAGRLRFRPDEGMAVRCRGRLTIYEGRGKFQLSVTDIEPTGAGALAIAFEQLKKKLAAEGLFDAARKRPLPFLPRRLGVVTSSSGAVIRDIIRVAHRRFPLPILLAPTPVQGDGAALSIASALRRLQDVPDVDVIIVARGGGSLEDLWAFNEEPVARAIVACRVPVVSAVGHETDFTIADFVADVRAPTPSAAAELTVPVADDLRVELLTLCQRGARAAQAHLRHRRLLLERARTRVGDPRRLLGSRRQAMDDLVERGHRAWRRRLLTDRTALRAAEMALYRSHPQRRIALQRAGLIALRERLQARIRVERDRRHRGLEACQAKLGALSPLRVLERGFSLTVGPDGHLVTRATQVRPGDRIQVRLSQGQLQAAVSQAAVSQAAVSDVGADPAAKDPEKKP